MKGVGKLHALPTDVIGTTHLSGLHQYQERPQAKVEHVSIPVHLVPVTHLAVRLALCEKF